MSETACRMCGACCDPVPFCLKERRAHLRQQAAYGNGEWNVSAEPWPTIIADAEFILAHWHVRRSDGKTYCDRFDRKTRRCRVHADSKPPVCRAYPMYEREHVPFPLHEGCAFKGLERLEKLAAPTGHQQDALSAPPP